MDIYQRWKKTTIANKGLVFSSVLMAFGTLFYAGAAIVQVYIMKHNASDASIQAERLIKASQAQAGAAQKIADASQRNAAAAETFSASAKNIAEQTEKAVGELRRAANDSEVAMKETSKNAKDALDASIEASRLDQRAWVSLVFPIELLNYNKIELYTPFRFKIKFKNTGKTPAIKISYDPVLVTQPITNATYPDYDVARAGQRPYLERIGITESALLGPGEEAFITFPGQPVNAQKMAFTKELVGSIDNLQTALFIVGMVSYHDVFPGTPERHTKFCLMYVPAKDASETGPSPKNRTMD